jgi:phage tail-like protein
MAEDLLLTSLPEVFQVAARTSAPLAALGAVATDLHAPVRELLATLDRTVDPVRCPPRMVGYLAAWVDLDWLTLPDRHSASRVALAGGSAPLRDLIVRAADLSARRGTAAGLTRFLHLATGVDGFTVEDRADAFHVVVHVPAAAAAQVVAVRRIVDTLKPAHVTAEVRLADAPPTALPPTPAPEPQPEPDNENENETGGSPA